MSATTGRKLLNAGRWALRHPGWVAEIVRSRARARGDRRRPFRLADHADLLCSVGGALESAFGVGPDRFAALRERVRVPPSPTGSRWGGGADMLALVGCLVLLRKPSTVIETGVAMGFTTSVILAAMRDNGVGSLHSIDLPPLQVDADAFVGQVVPPELHDRWTLHTGPTRRLLPGLARRLAPFELLVHDSDHTYAGQLADYRTAWPHLVPGGCLVSDDVLSPAFTDFAAEVGSRPYLIAAPGHDAAVGLLVKPG